MKLKEWEEQFDREQKLKERKQILKDERLKQNELLDDEQLPVYKAVKKTYSWMTGARY